MPSLLNDNLLRTSILKISLKVYGSSVDHDVATNRTVLTYMIYVCVCLLYHASSLNFGFVMAVRIYIIVLWFLEGSHSVLLHTPFICFPHVSYCVHSTNSFLAMLLQTFCLVIYIELHIRTYRKMSRSLH